MTQPATVPAATTAPDAALAPKPGETPAAPAAPAPDPDAALRAAAKARSDAYKQQTAAKRARIEADTRQSSLARKEQELTAREAAIASDPLKFLQRAGVGGDEIAKLLQGPQTETAEDRVARLEAKLAEREQAEANAQQERELADRVAQQEATVREHAIAFGKFADEHDDDYPELAALGESDPHRVLNEWRRVQTEVARSGYTYSHAEMADYLNNFARPYVEKTVQRYEAVKQKKAAKLQPVVVDEKADPKKKANGADAKAGTPRTLSAQLSAERSDNGTPIDRLPEKEQTRRLAEILRTSRKD